MMPGVWRDMWTGLGPAVGNHLWQSTVFAGAAGLLALALRKNHARARYWVWLAASAKFLIPFSLLVAMGGYLAPARTVAEANPGVYLAMEKVSQPFALPTAATIAPMAQPVASGAAAATPWETLLHALPALLCAAWLCGFLAVLSLWCMRWRRVSIMVREATLMREGREVDALRRLERDGMSGRRKPIEMLASHASLEPGIFGIARPVLLWPEGISARLDDAQLEAILAHELGHVRRRDNWAAAMHMAVEAIFWFYPVVWWLGARLVEERERACDEQVLHLVLRLGKQPQAYAEGILKVCEFCVESPLACVSGITGADLKKRVVRIMTGRAAHKLNLGRKLLLTAAGLMAIGAPLVFGLAAPQQGVPAPSAAEQRAQQMAQFGTDIKNARVRSAQTSTTPPPFEVASIRPNRTGTFNSRITPARFAMQGARVMDLIVYAYDLQNSQVLGAPKWIGSERYDIEAKVDDSTAEREQRLPAEEQYSRARLRVQELLADRFGLKVHHSTKRLAVLALVVAKGGPRLSQVGPDKEPGGLRMSMDGKQWTLISTGVPLSVLLRPLSGQPEISGNVLMDKTGLTGNYAFRLQWAPQNLSDSSAAGTEPPGPTLYTALQEQLGLKIESRKEPVDVIVIDQIHAPSEN